MGTLKHIAIINGPNLDRLGKREPEIYGSTTLADLEASLKLSVAGKPVELEFFQSNHEGAIIDKFSQLAEKKIDGIIINPAGLTHTSVALRDAIAGSKIPTIEVHISNIYRREEFRHKSVTANAAVAVITGLGLDGYFAALQFLLK